MPTFSTDPGVGLYNNRPHRNDRQESSRNRESGNFSSKGSNSSNRRRFGNNPYPLFSKKGDDWL